MRFANRFITLCLITTTTSCNSVALDRGNVILNKQLSAAQRNYDESWTTKRSPLEFSGGNVATNCQEYLDLLSSRDIIESVNNQIIKNEYLICDALKLLGKNTYASQRSPKVGEGLSTRLDLRSFPSSLFRFADASKHTLSALGPAHLTLDDAAVVMETSDWILRLEVVAIADINHNAKLDWVIWVSDQAKQGNYRSYATLVAYDVPAHGKILATPFPSDGPDKTAIKPGGK